MELDLADRLVSWKRREARKTSYGRKEPFESFKTPPNSSDKKPNSSNNNRQYENSKSTPMNSRGSQRGAGKTNASSHYQPLQKASNPGIRGGGGVRNHYNNGGGKEKRLGAAGGESDDDENWYTPGPPDEESLPLEAPSTVEPVSERTIQKTGGGKLQRSKTFPTRANLPISVVTSRLVVRERQPLSGRRLFDPEKDPVSGPSPSIVNQSRIGIVIPAEDLNIQAKNLWAEINDMEKLCNKTGDRHRRLKHELSMDHWKEYVANHTKLIKLYHGLLMQEPEQLVSSMVERIWKTTTYNLVGAVRRAVKDSPTPELYFSILSQHICAGEEFFEALMNTIKIRGDPDWWKCTTMIGDLARYRGSYGLSSGGETEASRKWWLNKAKIWYLFAWRLQPSIGIPVLTLYLNNGVLGRTFNELAVISTGNQFATFYYLIRALTASNVFQASKNFLQEQMRDILDESEEGEVEEGSDCERLKHQVITLISAAYFQQREKVAEKSLVIIEDFKERLSNGVNAGRGGGIHLPTCLKLIIICQSAVSGKWAEKITMEPLIGLMIECLHQAIKVYEKVKDEDVLTCILVFAEIMLIWLNAQQGEATINKYGTSIKDVLLAEVKLPSIPSAFWSAFANFLTYMASHFEQDISTETEMLMLPEDLEFQGLPWFESVLPQLSENMIATMQSISEPEEALEINLEDREWKGKFTQHNLVRVRRLVVFGKKLCQKYTTVMQYDSTKKIFSVQDYTMKSNLSARVDMNFLDEEDNGTELDKELVHDLALRKKQLQEQLNQQQPGMTDGKRRDKRTVISLRDRLLVFDTNCYLSNLKLIKAVLNKQSSYVIVPLAGILFQPSKRKMVNAITFAVLMELDGLSVNTYSTVGEQAAEAIRFIEQAVEQKNLRVITSQGNVMQRLNIRTETFRTANDESGGYKRINTDDVILQSCALMKNPASFSFYDYAQRKVVQGSTHHVLLVTKDTNLRVKSRVQEVEVIDAADVRAALKRKEADDG